MKFGNKMYCQISDRSVRLKENSIWEGILCGLFHGSRTNIILHREAIRRLFLSENILIARIKRVIESITQQFSLEPSSEREREWPQNQFGNTVITIETTKWLHSKAHVIFLILNFRRVLNVACFLLGNAPASEFICRRFGTLCSIFIGR